jgi:hypothetical protein
MRAFCDWCSRPRPRPPRRAWSAIRSSEVDGLSLRFVISSRLNRRAHSRLVHGSGHVVRALGARAERAGLSGCLIVGGCLLMHDGRAYRVRRKAGCGSGTGVRHEAGRRYLSPQPVTCRPRCRARNGSSTPGQRTSCRSPGTSPFGGRGPGELTGRPVLRLSRPGWSVSGRRRAPRPGERHRPGHLASVPGRPRRGVRG